MNNGKVRIYELSKELGLENKDILAICERLEISAKSHSSSITSDDAVKIQNEVKQTSGKLLNKPTKPSPPRRPQRPAAPTPRPAKKQQILEIRRHQAKPPVQEVRSTEKQTKPSLRKARSDVSNSAPGILRLIKPQKGFSAENQLESVTGPKVTAGVTGFKPIRKQLQLQTTHYLEKLDLDENIDLDMVLVKGGTFLMGSPEDELESHVDEKPLHRVMLEAFFIGRYPVTQMQWQIVAKMPPVNRRLTSDNKVSEGDYPVKQVCWHDAVEFCDRLTVHTGRQYRLPTESEWEFACRAGKTTPFYFGQTLSKEIATYDSNPASIGGYEGSLPITTRVTRTKIANGFGLSDMHGNIFEWCEDCWHDTYEYAPTDGSAWVDGNNSDRVVRGGAYYSPKKDCRSAFRYHASPDVEYDGVGLRVACNPPKSLSVNR